MTVAPAPAPDAEQAKQATRAQWDRCARGWNDSAPLLRGWLRQATDAMLDMAGIRPGQRVLDIACGAGDQTLDIAARVGPAGCVLATDLSPEILEYACANCLRAGYENVQTRVADGETLAAGADWYDAAICRLGLMFFPDPLAGLRAMHRALKPGGAACTMVFGAPPANPCIVILMQTALAHAGLPPRDPFQPGGLLSLGRPGLIDALFAEAGFRAVETRAMSAPFDLPSAAAYLAFIRKSASPIQQILQPLPAAAQQAAWAEMEQKLKQFDTPTGWSGPNELLVTAGRK